MEELGLVAIGFLLDPFPIQPRSARKALWQTNGFLHHCSISILVVPLFFSGTDGETLRHSEGPPAPGPGPGP